MDIGVSLKVKERIDNDVLIRYNNIQGFRISIFCLICINFYINVGSISVINNRQVKISNNTLIIPINKYRAFGTFVSLCFIATLSFVKLFYDKNLNDSLLLLIITLVSSVGSILSLAVLFSKNVGFQIDSRGITWVRLFDKKFILWSDILAIRKMDYSRKISIILRNKRFPIIIFSSSFLSPYGFYKFLTECKRLTTKSAEMPISMFHNLFLDILNESGKQSIRNYIQSKRPINNSKQLATALGADKFLHFKLNIFVARYFSGVFLLICTAIILNQLLIISKGNNWSVDLVLMILASSLSSFFLYYLHVAIFYDPILKVAFRGFSVFGRIVNIKKIIDGVTNVVIINRGIQISYYWVALSDYDLLSGCKNLNIIFCKLFITRWQARKFCKEMAKIINVKEVDLSRVWINNNIRKYSKYLNAFNSLNDVFISFVLLMPYVGLIYLNIIIFLKFLHVPIYL